MKHFAKTFTKKIYLKITLNNDLFFNKSPNSITNHYCLNIRDLMIEITIIEDI